MQPNSTNVDSTQALRTLIYVYAFFHPMSSQYVINKCKIERINQTINLLNCQTIKKNQIAKAWVFCSERAFIKTFTRGNCFTF